MTLDPVHFEGIARLARRIEPHVDPEEHRDLAADAWESFLDPLYVEGEAVLEPLGEQRRRRVPIEDIALEDPPFPSSHGLDAGTINPRTFRNGVVLDVAQAAMAAVPSDLDLHRSRTVVATVHSNDATVRVEDDWEAFDAGYSRGRLLDAPRVDRYAERVVHALSLYFAESSHALEHADRVDDVLVLDGPLYPKGILNWLDRHPELADLLTTEEEPRQVIGNYLELVERFAERDVPLVGFVKNYSAKPVVRALREAGIASPWVDDAAFFSRVLERRERTEGGYERRTDELTCTNWFVSRAGPDRVVAADSEELTLDRERALAPAAYEVCFCVAYDPRTDLAYKLETPAAFARDPDCRERLTRLLLRELAVRRGPPEAVAKADELARIGTDERESLIRTIERTFDTETDRDYDAHRWGPSPAE